MAELKDLRSLMKARRRGLEPDTRRLAAESVASAVIELPEFAAARTVAAYTATRGELDPSGILAAVHSSGRLALLPVVGDEHSMTFAPVSPDTPFRENRYGIAEPVVPAEEHLAAMDLDFVVVPTVAFHSECHRVGSGGGYYDRAFSPLSGGGRRNGPVLCGVAFDLQQVDHLDPEPWDVTLDIVVTETRVIRRPAGPVS